MANSKGQVIIEYLINYGWALLVLAIVMAAMLATGVFNPSYFVIEECYLGSSFSCHAQLASISGSTVAYINVSNTMGYPIRLANITFSAENVGGVAGIRNETATMNLDMNTGSSTIATAVFSGQTQKGSVKKILMQISYYICAEEVNPTCAADSSYLRTVSGRMVQKVS